MSPSMSLNSQNKYEIKIYGQSDDSWLGSLGQVQIHTQVLADHSQVTTFSDVVMDQAGLVGLIRRLHGLGIVLISIVGCEPGDSCVAKTAPVQNETTGTTDN